MRHLDYVAVLKTKPLLLAEMGGDNISRKGTTAPCRMNDIKAPFLEERKNGKDDGTGYQKANVGQKLGAGNRRHLVAPDLRQVNSINSVTENRNLMVFAKPLD